MKLAVRTLYSAARLRQRVAQMGRAISRDYAGRTLDVAILDSAFIFAADLVRHITCPVVCHFVRAEMRDVHLGGFERKEIFFNPEPNLKGRDVLLVDAVLHSGVTLDFLVKRMTHQNPPRSLRIAVLVDKPQERRVDIRPDYFGFQAASNYLVGYGLPDGSGLYRNLPYVGVLQGTSFRSPSVAARGKRKAAKRSKAKR